MIGVRRTFGIVILVLHINDIVFVVGSFVLESVILRARRVQQRSAHAVVQGQLGDILRHHRPSSAENRVSPVLAVWYIRGPTDEFIVRPAGDNKQCGSAASQTHISPL